MKWAKSLEAAVSEGRYFPTARASRTLAGIKSEYDCTIAGSVGFPRALMVAKMTIDDVAWKLDADSLGAYAADDPAMRYEIERLQRWREHHPS